jgi:hypothetical protein
MAMPLPELIAKGQKCAQIWEHILYSSGGSLNLKKCFWYLVYATTRIDCKRTEVCSNLGAYTVQFWWFFESEEVFLVSCLLAMD